MNREAMNLGVHLEVPSKIVELAVERDHRLRGNASVTVRHSYVA